MDDSAMMCDEIIELDNEETNFNEKTAAYKAQKLYILLALLLTTVALMIAASIQCYLIEQNKNIYYHFTTQITNQKKLCIKNINKK